MVLARHQALHLIGTEPGLQPLDQSRQAFMLVLGRGEELDVRWRTLRDVFGLQPEVERGRRQLHLRQSLPQQHEQVSVLSREGSARAISSAVACAMHSPVREPADQRAS